MQAEKLFHYKIIMENVRKVLETFISGGRLASNVKGHFTASRSCVAIVAACRLAQTVSCSLVYTAQQQRC